MATKTFDELKQLAIQIRDEKTNKQNTANRVGSAMLEAINKLEQDYYDKTNIDEQAKNTTQSITNLNTKIDKRTTEYNVSVNNPTSGTSGTNRYDLAGAITQVPAELRTGGVKVSFLNSAGKPESWKYQGGSWAVANFIKEADGGNKILEWAGDSATTRKQVSANERKAGMQISYKPDGEDWINEQYIGTSFTDTEWVKDENWGKITTESDNNLLFRQCNVVFDELINGLHINLPNFEIGYYKSDGSIVNDKGFIRAELSTEVYAKNGLLTFIGINNPNGALYWIFKDSNGGIISSIQLPSKVNAINIPENCATICICITKKDEFTFKVLNVDESIYEYIINTLCYNRIEDYKIDNLSFESGYFNGGGGENANSAYKRVKITTYYPTLSFNFDDFGIGIKGYVKSKGKYSDISVYLRTDLKGFLYYDLTGIVYEEVGINMLSSNDETVYKYPILINSDFLNPEIKNTINILNSMITDYETVETTFTIGAIDWGGKLSTNYGDAYGYTDYIPIFEGQYLSFFKNYEVGITGSYYDNNRQYIESISSNDLSTESDFNILKSKHTGYVRLNFRKDFSTDGKLYFGNVATAFNQDSEINFDYINVNKILNLIYEVVNKRESVLSQDILDTYIEPHIICQQRGLNEKNYETNEYVPLFLCAGQSNMKGVASQTTFPVSWETENGQTVNYEKTLSDVDYCFKDLDGNSSPWALSTNPQGFYGFDSLLLQKIRYFYQTIKGNPEQKLAWCKVASSGSPISTDLEPYLDPVLAGFWDPFFENIDKFNESHSSSYQKLTAYAEQCCRTFIKKNPTYSPVCIFWHQGETDGTNAIARVKYYQNMKNVIYYMRGFFGRANLPFVMGTQPDNSGQFNEIVRKAQERLAKELSNVFLVRLDECPNDGLHFTSPEGYEYAAKAYYEMFRDNIYPYIQPFEV